MFEASFCFPVITLLLSVTGDHRRDAVGGSRRCEAACSSYEHVNLFEPSAICRYSVSSVMMAAKLVLPAPTDVPFEDEQANRYWLTPNGDRLGYDPNVRDMLCSPAQPWSCLLVPRTLLLVSLVMQPCIIHCRRTDTAGWKTGRRSTSVLSTTIRYPPCQQYQHNCCRRGLRPRQQQSCCSLMLAHVHYCF